MKTIWSYGGGIQSIAIAVLIFQEKLPKPDLIVFADTGREKFTTLKYYHDNLEREFVKSAMVLEIADHSLATVDMYAYNGDLLIPAFTKKGKLPTFCSNEWKKLVIRRYLRKQEIKKCKMLIGFSIDEFERMKDSGVKWITNIYPLVELRLTRYDCKRLVEDYGLPTPPRSSCWMCPHQSDEEWKALTLEDFEKATQFQRDIQEKDNELFLTPYREDLAITDFNKKREPSLFGCQEGTCFT